MFAVATNPAGRTENDFIKFNTLVSASIINFEDVKTFGPANFD